MTRPVVVVGRPRSGSRLVAGMLIDAGVWLGSDLDPDSLDSRSICQRFVAPLLTGFPLREGWEREEAFERWCRSRLEDALAAMPTPRPHDRPWGWKLCETALLILVVKRLLPGARFIHVIRDGRDVSVSCDGYFQLSGPRPELWGPPAVDGAQPGYRDFCRAVTVGDAKATRWRGIELTDLGACLENRFQLQMQSWAHCVTAARAQAAGLRDDYIEVSYEQLCRDPAEVTRALGEWLGEAALRPPRSIDRSRIGRWRHMRLTVRERRDFERAMEYGRPLLQELGYAC